MFRALKPFTDAAIEVDIVQLTPLTIYNFIVFDQLQDLPPIDQYDPKDPPPSIIVVSLGTDTTDLVITNGYRVWQRNIPLGGNHFTKALTKELKLTFTKAEHLKRNALKAEDPEGRVSGDAAGVQRFGERSAAVDQLFPKRRSHGQDRPRDHARQRDEAARAAKISGPKPGLRSDRSGAIPRPERTQRRQRAGVQGKRPVVRHLLWPGFAGSQEGGAADQPDPARNPAGPPDPGQKAVGRRRRGRRAAGLLRRIRGPLAGLELGPRERTLQASTWHAASDIEKQAADYDNKFKESKAEFAKVKDIGDRLESIGYRRLMWVEVMRAISESLPHDADSQRSTENLKPEQLRDMLLASKRIEIDSLDCEHYPKLEDWFADVREKWLEGATRGGHDVWSPRGPGYGYACAAGAGAAPLPGSPVAGAPAQARCRPARLPLGGTPGAVPGAAPANPAAGPTGEGWVIQIIGHHYHNNSPGNEGPNMCAARLMRNLEEGTVSIPSPDGKTMMQVPLKDLGIGYAVLIRAPRPFDEEIPLPGTSDQPTAGPGAQARDPNHPNTEPKTVTVQRCDFIVQFCWKETPLNVRLEKSKAASEPSPTLQAGNPVPRSN